MNRTFEDLIRTAAKLTDEDEKIITKELAKAYKDVYDKTVKDLADLYSKLGDKIDLPEARKYKRLEALMESLAKEYKELTGTVISTAKDTMANVYQNAFYGYTWAMEQAVKDGAQVDPVKLGASWGVIPKDAITASVVSEWSGLTISKTLDRAMVYRLSDVQAVLTRGLATGSAYRKVAAELRDKFNLSLSDAMRIAVTEIGRNHTQGFLAAHDRAVAAGIDVKKRWDATLDGRTRKEHAAADGQYADSEGNFHVGGCTGKGPGMLVGLNQAAMTINCRCRATDELEGFPPEVRRIDGEIQPYVTFEQWAGSDWSPKTGWKKKK